jgi:hypothetical protein
MVDTSSDPERAALASSKWQACRTATDVASIRQSFLESLYFVQARFPEVATRNDYYLALAWTVRDRLLRRWVDTAATYYRHASRSVWAIPGRFPGRRSRTRSVSVAAPPCIIPMAMAASGCAGCRRR